MGAMFDYCERKMFFTITWCIRYASSMNKKFSVQFREIMLLLKVTFNLKSKKWKEPLLLAEIEEFNQVERTFLPWEFNRFRLNRKFKGQCSVAQNNSTNRFLHVARVTLLCLLYQQQHRYNTYYHAIDLPCNFLPFLHAYFFLRLLMFHKMLEIDMLFENKKKV